MKNILITGSSRGIGKATAQIFVQNNYNVIGTSTSGESSLNHSNFTCKKLALDSDESVADFCQELRDQNISLDGIINNAAILLEDENAGEIDLQKLRQTFAVNLFGIVNLTESLLGQLNDGFHIINIASVWGAFSDGNFSKFQPHYKISKAALNMYSKTLSQRLVNGRVSAFDPGWVKTDMGGFNASKEPTQVGQELLELFERDVKSGQFWREGRVRDW